MTYGQMNRNDTTTLLKSAPPSLPPLPPSFPHLPPGPPTGGGHIQLHFGPLCLPFILFDQSVDIAFFGGEEEDAEEPAPGKDNSSEDNRNLEAESEVGEDVPQEEETQVESAMDEEGRAEGPEEGGREGGVDELGFGDAAAHQEASQAVEGDGEEGAGDLEGEGGREGGIGEIPERRREGGREGRTYRGG